MALDVVFFELRGRRCALPVSAVREVLPMPSPTPVPLAPAAVRGLAPVHGQVIPILDLGVWLASGHETREAPLFRPTSDKILLVEGVPTEGDLPPVRAGLAVDRVVRLGTVDEEHARPANATAPFVTATLMDREGAALLFDVGQALAAVRAALVSAAAAAVPGGRA